jgi:hypothetical protein
VKDDLMGDKKNEEKLKNKIRESFGMSPMLHFCKECVSDL